MSLISNHKKSIKGNKSRMWELDFFRGLAILLMVVDHILFNLSEFYGINIPFIYAPLNGNPIGMAYSFLETFFRLIFIIISGICCVFSKNNLLRGLRLLAIALIVTLVTYLVSYLSNSDEVIVFGILHCLSICMITGYFMNKLPYYASAILGGCIILLDFSHILGNIVPSTNYLMIFGITTGNFFSADYFPLIPYLGWFLIGLTLGKLFYKNTTSNAAQKNEAIFPTASQKLRRFFDLKPNFINFAGRHSLWIYVLHQPVVLAVMYLLLGAF